MRRPAMTAEALGFRPALEAGGADASGVERVPCMSAGTSPEVLFARRPSAEKASDARARRPHVFFVFEIPVEDGE
jgi:hypothetical protein